MQEYDFTIKYQKGALNADVDSLSSSRKVTKEQQSGAAQLLKSHFAIDVVFKPQAPFDV